MSLSRTPLSRTPGLFPLCRCGHTRASHNARARMCYGGPTCGCAEYRPVEDIAPTPFSTIPAPTPYGVRR